MTELPTRIHHPARWRVPERAVTRVRVGDAIRNPTSDARQKTFSEREWARKLAVVVDNLLAARGMRIDNTALVVGYVVEMHAPSCASGVPALGALKPRKTAALRRT